MSTDFNGGSFGGDAEKIADDSVLECKICWHIYDPNVGDEYWQVPAGTPFSELPEQWACPNCDGVKNEFMVVEAKT